MAKPTGPLLSLGASGTIAKTLTFSKWKGRPYIRQRVIPANPQTTEQSKTRNAFTWSSDLWKNLPTLGIAPWDRFAQGQVLSGRNAMIGKNVEALRAAILADDLIGSPGAKGGLAPESIVGTPGVNNISYAVTVPAPPTGWTLQAAVGLQIPQQNPQTSPFVSVQVLEDLVAPYELDFTGLVTASDYVATIWLRWAKPDASIAYGASINATDTTL